jgi:hypothetical protein
LSFRGSLYSLVLTLSLMTVSLMPCRHGMVSHPSAGNDQLLSGPTIALGPFLQLLAAPYS